MASIKETFEEPLQIIPTEKLHDLLQILETDFPDSLYVQGVLLNVTKRKKISGRPSRTKIYAPYGNYEDGSFISITRQTSQRIAICFFSLDPSASRVETALKKTSVIDWRSTEPLITFDGIYDRFLPIVEKICALKNMKKTYEIKLITVYMNREDAIMNSVECPPELRIDYLSPKHAKKINDEWAFKFDGSQEYFERLLESNFGLGLYHRDTGELIGWSIFSYYSGMATLHTIPMHRKKGYAQLICDAMAKHSAKIGIDPRAIIYVNNVPSLSLFSKLRYKTSGCVNNFELEPEEEEP